MNSNNRLLAALVAAALVVALALGVLAAFRPSAINVTVPGSNNGTPGGLTVNGSATVHVVPDTAIFDFGVSANARTVASARAAADKSAQAALAALRQLGIADKDITTTNISLYQQYPSCPQNYYPPVPAPGASGDSGTGSGGAPISAPAASDGSSPAASPVALPSGVTIAPPAVIGPTTPIVPLPCKIYSYTFSESFEATIRTIERLGPAIDAVSNAGITDISGIRFSLADQSSPESSARTAAVANAHDQAETLANAAGAKLGAVLSISETSSNPFDYYLKGAPVAAGVSSTPVSPGTLDITVNVTLTYALGQ